MPPAAAQGELRADRVHVADTAQANRLHNKGTIGAPQPGNALELTLVEAAWCVAQGRLAVLDGGRALDVLDLLARGSGGSRRTEVDYLAYADLRGRGFVVRPAPGTTPGPGRFDAWPRGTSQGPPAFRIVACSARDAASGADLVAWAGDGLVMSVVDDDGALKHFALAFDEPRGEVAPARLPKAKGRGLAERVAVGDPAAAAAYAAQHVGRPYEGGTLLSSVEAEWLRASGLLSVESEAAGGAADTRFGAILPAFVDLRARGVVPKSGFQFGTHLRGYRGAPDDEHAEWLVHCLGAQPLALADLSRGVRLSHGVRKKFLVAVATGSTVRYVQASWFRP